MRTIFFADLTAPDVALAGWHVVRALCKHFEPFPGDFKYEKPSIIRVNQFLTSQGISEVSVINTDPFPFT